MDFAIRTTEQGPDLDLGRDGPQVDPAGLRTAALLSLACHRSAEDPDAAGERRGYWADALQQDDLWGSLLWLLQRAKAKPESRRLAEEYARDALRWMVRERVARSVEAEASGDGKVLRVRVRITLRAGDVIDEILEV